MVILDRFGDAELNDDGLSAVFDELRIAAGDLRKLFLGQLRELLVQGFHFLFQGVQFFFRFRRGMLLSNFDFIS